MGVRREKDTNKIIVSKISKRGMDIMVMPASRERIEEWFVNGVEKNATHLIVAVDRFDGFMNYPIYVHSKEEAEKKVAEYEESDDKIMEIYNLSMDRKVQLEATRAWNL